MIITPEHIKWICLCLLVLIVATLGMIIFMLCAYYPCPKKKHYAMNKKKVNKLMESNWDCNALN